MVGLSLMPVKYITSQEGWGRPEEKGTRGGAGGPGGMESFSELREQFMAS